MQQLSVPIEKMTEAVALSASIGSEIGGQVGALAGAAAGAKASILDNISILDAIEGNINIFQPLKVVTFSICGVYMNTSPKVFIYKPPIETGSTLSESPNNLVSLLQLVHRMLLDL